MLAGSGRADDTPAPIPYSQDERLFISQCEMSLPACAAVSLTGESSLSAWMNAWHEAGILNEAASAMLGDVGGLVSMLERNRVNLKDIREHEWPELGLRTQLETVRIELNQMACAGAPVPRSKPMPAMATAACLYRGIEAPLIEWVRVWFAAGMNHEIVSAVSGIGFRHLPGSSISHCEMSSASFHVRLFTPGKVVRQRSSYVLSGYWYEGSQCTYTYHPITREHIPSIDSYNWIAGHRLGVTRQLRCSHPFELIKHVQGDKLDGVVGKHCLGLLIERFAPGDEQASRISPEVHDVLTHAQAERAMVSQAGLASITSNQMPGVYPATWIIDPGTEDNSPAPATMLYRPATAYESVVNDWYHQVAVRVGLPGFEAGAFRNAKWPAAESDCGAVNVLCHPASVFAATTAEHATAVSSFRLPLGSLLGAALVLKGDPRQSLESATKQLFGLLRRTLCNPEKSLRNLMRWIIFDAINGSLPQMPYRYQVVLTGEGFTLAAIPFWSSEPAQFFADHAQRQFGFQIAVDEESITTLLTNRALTELAHAAGIDQADLIPFRDECIEAFQRSVPLIQGDTPDFDVQKITAPFRSAKWKAARVTKKATA